MNLITIITEPLLWKCFSVITFTVIFRTPTSHWTYQTRMNTHSIPFQNS